MTHIISRTTVLSAQLDWAYEYHTLIMNDQPHHDQCFKINRYVYMILVCVLTCTSRKTQEMERINVAYMTFPGLAR